MNHKKYIEFHDKFTKENQFEFSHGIYLLRDLVRNRPVSQILISDFFYICKRASGIEDVLKYLLDKNKNSLVTVSAIELLQENII